MVQVEVYRIGHQPLMNAFRHADAAHIEIEIAYGVREFCLFVRDDGRGVDPHEVTHAVSPDIGGSPACASGQNAPGVP